MVSNLPSSDICSSSQENHLPTGTVPYLTTFILKPSNGSIPSILNGTFRTTREPTVVKLELNYQNNRLEHSIPMFLLSIAKHPMKKHNLQQLESMKSDCGNITIQKNPPEKCMSHFNVASVTPLCRCLRGQSVGTAARKTTLMISCQVEPFPHFSFPQTLSVFPPRAKWNIRLNTLLLQLMTSLSLQVNHSLQKPYLAPPLVKRGHFKNSLSSHEWSDHKTNGFKLTWLTEEEVQQYGDLRSALPLCFTGCIL